MHCSKLATMPLQGSQNRSMRFALLYMAEGPAVFPLSAHIIHLNSVR